MQRKGAIEALAHGGRGQSVLRVATASREAAVATLRGRAMAAPFCGGRLRWKRRHAGDGVGAARRVRRAVSASGVAAVTTLRGRIMVAPALEEGSGGSVGGSDCKKIYHNFIQFCLLDFVKNQPN